MLTRRALLSAVVGARGMEAQRESQRQAPPAEFSGFRIPKPGDIIISGNENPLGPGPRALDAIETAMDESSRYPMNSTITDADVAAKIASRFDTGPENIVLGAGSGEILRNTVRSFASKDRPLVTGLPSYGSPVGTAKVIGAEVRAVPVDGDLKLDLGKMAEAAKGAGVVFFCNPNNPTATVHGKHEVEHFIETVHAGSPDTVILIDEAYHDYVTDPSHATAAPIALAKENVIVARTFSKAYGLAGMRLGYAVGREPTLEKLKGYKLTFNTNVLVMAAAMSSLSDPEYIPTESERNRAVRQYTLDFFKDAGVPASDSQTNFIFVELGYPAAKFRDACADRGVHVGRDFPPLEKTHCRISIGTMDEMKKATEVFAAVIKEVA